MKSKIFYFLIFVSFLNIKIHAKNKIKIVCTTTIIYDITKNIGDTSLDIQCLMPIGGDPHIYDPLPADAQKVADAQLIIKNGLYLEGWLNELIDNSGKKQTVIEAAKGIEPIQNLSLHASPDPHAWMNPKHGKIYAINITNALVEIDQFNQFKYKKKATEYLLKLDSLDLYIKTKIEQIPPEKRVLITSHDAFRYFGKEYGIRVESAMGTSTDAEAQIGDINRLVNIIKETGIPAIFVESTINPKLINQLATDNNVVIGGKLFADSIGDEISGAGTYIEMLKYNVDTIVNGLSTKKEKSLAITNDLLILLLSTGTLFIGVFIFVFLKVRPQKSAKLNWHNYTIDVQNLSVTYEKKRVLTNINFQLDAGKVYGLLGPNGAGKSTLFKAILGLITPDSGLVNINNNPVSKIRDKIAYIPQKEEIDWEFPATVFDVVLSGRMPAQTKFRNYNSDDRNKTIQAIHKMGLDEFRNRQIGDLSGGQQQRVFIARALCQEAEVLFFDEPFVGVDVTTEEKIIQIIKTLAKEGKTVLMIHHDLSKVKDYFDSVIMVNQRLIACGPTIETFTNDNISKTYSGRLSILQETDHYHAD
ncbi:MAG: zinc ABC transporter substrate-binding protein [Bacteroidota bacterium]|nr:zinc ABC transporter substrate-binding protein [Bacteroidota bacterium]